MTKARIYFFDSEARQNALRYELAGWRGTRFKRGAGNNAKRGVCADCVSFVESALVAVKAIQPITWPKYVVSGAGDAMQALITQTLAEIPELERIATLLPGDTCPELLVGDIALCVSEKGMPHLAIYAGDNNLWHCTERMGAAPVNLHPAKKFFRAVYRVKYHKPAGDLSGNCRTCDHNRK